MYCIAPTGVNSTWMLSLNAPGSLAHGWTAFQSCCDPHRVSSLKGPISCHSRMRMLGLLSTKKILIKIHSELQLGLRHHSSLGFPRKSITSPNSKAKVGGHYGCPGYLAEVGSDVIGGEGQQEAPGDCLHLATCLERVEAFESCPTSAMLSSPLCVSETESLVWWRGGGQKAAPHGWVTGDTALSWN